MRFPALGNIFCGERVPLLRAPMQQCVTAGAESDLLLLEKRTDVPVVEQGTVGMKDWLRPNFKHQSHFSFCSH